MWFKALHEEELSSDTYYFALMSQLKEDRFNQDVVLAETIPFIHSFARVSHHFTYIIYILMVDVTTAQHSCNFFLQSNIKSLK